MKYILNHYKQCIAMIVSLSLVVTSLPAQAFSKSYLAAPGATELSPGFLQNPNRRVSVRILKQDISEPHSPYRVITVQDKHFYAVTITCGFNFLPEELQPACGGVIFLENKDEFQKPEIGKALLERATSLAQDADRTSALWNTYLRGGATIILSDGERNKKDVLREWAGRLAEKKLLGWKYIVTSDLGTTEEDMSVIADSAYEAGLRKYLKEMSKDRNKQVEKIEQIIQNRNWQALGMHSLWKLGLILPAASTTEDYPEDLGAIALVSAIRMILWFAMTQGKTSKKIIPDIKKTPDIIVDGFGLTGSSIDRALIKRLPGNTRFIGASDEHGGIYNSSGLDSITMLNLITQKRKEEGLSLSGDYTGRAGRLVKGALLHQKADILILANRRYELTDDDVEGIQAKIVMEAVPGILSEKQINRLYEKGILYISSLWLNGGIFFGSARERILHTLVPRELKHISDMPLHVQSGVSESALAVMFEELNRCQLAMQPGRPKPRAWVIGREMAKEIRSNELRFWRSISGIAKILQINLEDLINMEVNWGVIVRVMSWKGILLKLIFYVLATVTRTKRIFRLARINYDKGRNRFFALSTAVSEIARQQVIYGKHSEERAIRDLKKGDEMEQRLAAFHMARLQPLEAIDILLRKLEDGDTFHIRANCAHALGFIYSRVRDEELKKEIVRGLIYAFSDLDEEVVEWAQWAISINDINLDQMLLKITQEIGLFKTPGHPEVGYVHRGRLYQMVAGIFDFIEQKKDALENRKRAQRLFRKAGAKHGPLALKSWLILARSYQQLGNDRSAIRECLHLINPSLITELLGFSGFSGAVEIGANEYRSLAIEVILNIYYPYNVDVNIFISDELNEAITKTNEDIDLDKHLDKQLKIVFKRNTKELHRYQVPYLGLLLIYGTEIFRKKEYTAIQDVLRDILMYHSLTDRTGEKLPDKKIEELIKFKRRGVFAELKPEQRDFILELFRGLKIIRQVGKTEKGSAPGLRIEKVGKDIPRSL